MVLEIGASFFTAAFPRSTATHPKERAMKNMKATGCPPLRGAASGGHGGQPCQPAGTALIAVALILPALAGCPAHLDDLAWFADAGRVTPAVDAAAAPAPPSMPVTPITMTPDAAPPSAPPPEMLDPATCA